MAKRYYWLKLQEDFFSAPKIKKLRRIAGGDTYTVIYLKMQLLSIKSGGIIEFQGIEPTFAEELSLILDEDIDNIKVTLSFLESQGLIEQSDDFKYLLTQAAENIGSESESASRVRTFRGKNQALALQCNGDVTGCNKKVTIDIDKDKEKDSKGKRKRFTPPTVEEVQEYCKERGNGIDAEHFMDYYAARGWKYGQGKPIVDWKAAVRNWEKNKFSGSSAKSETNNRNNTSFDVSALENIDYFSLEESKK